MMTDYFALFKLPCDFVIDLSSLKKSYQELIKKYHPDNSPNNQEGQMLQQTELLNNAYQTLLSPAKRAYYLLERTGLELTQTFSDDEMLGVFMNLHEQIAVIKEQEDLTALDDFANRVIALQQDLSAQFADLWSDQDNLSAHIKQLIRLAKSLFYIENFQEKIKQLFNELDN